MTEPAHATVLLVEDHRDIAEMIVEFLEQQGYSVDFAGDGVTGLHLATVNDYDVIILDLSLPGMDGLEVCGKLRAEARKSTPVLILTSRDTLPDKLSGFERGADDYLIKPFALQELEARLQALARRLRGGNEVRLLQLADLSFNLDTLQVQRAGHPIPLTPTGLRILEMLMRKPGCVVTRRELETALWGDLPPDSDALRSHIHALRSAIDKSFSPPLLHTLHGIGYRLAIPDALQA